MRIHIQSRPPGPAYFITFEQWREALARSGEPPHAVSFGTSPPDWGQARGETELLVTQADVLRSLLPLDAPALRLVFVTNAGVDGLAPFDWVPDGVTLLNNSGAHAPKAGEYIAMAALMLAARMPEMQTNQRAARWEPVFSPPLAGRRVTIVGVGDLGSAGARALRALGIATVGVRTRAEPHPDFDEIVAVADLDEVLTRSDFLVVTCPLTPATRGMFDRRRLGLLPQGAGLVNIGRGKLLDSEALCDLLDSGKLGGAILDVTDPEPLPPNHRMWRTPNLVITPHVSCDDPISYTARSLEILFGNLRAWRKGEPLPNRVDLSRGY
jgi:phosphoglycerate dehydrogenase-like enzyme